MRRFFREHEVLAWFGIGWICLVVLLLLIAGGGFSQGISPRQEAFWDLALKGIGGLVAVAGATVATVKYLDEKARNTHVALMEVQKPFHTKRQEVYYELVSATSTLSNKAPGSPEYVCAEDKFWHLYWGALPLVTDRDVGGATNRFEDVLVDQSMDADVKSVSLRHASKDLAERCRNSLGFA